MKDVIDLLAIEANKYDHFAKFPQDVPNTENHRDIKVLIHRSEYYRNLAKQFDDAIKILNRVSVAAEALAHSGV